MYCVSRHTNALEVEPVLESEDKEFARLVDWVEGRVSEREARILEKQVASNATMHDNVTWLRAFALISEATVIASPPSEVRDILVDRFEEYAVGKRSSGWLKRVVATLSFDSNLQPAHRNRSGNSSTPPRSPTLPSTSGRALKTG